jgi:hypothetical protein
MGNCPLMNDMKRTRRRMMSEEAQIKTLTKNQETTK